MNIQRYFLETNSKLDLIPAECGIANLKIEESEKKTLSFANFYIKKLEKISIGKIDWPGP